MCVCVCVCVCVRSRASECGCLWVFLFVRAPVCCEANYPPSSEKKNVNLPGKYL